MRVLVTGASGFLGRHLVPHLVRCGHELYCTFRRRALPGEWEGQGVIGLCWDLERQAQPNSSGCGLDAVIHLAGYMPEADQAPFDKQFLTANVEATDRLLGWSLAQGVNRFVYSSSVKVYGPVQQVPIGEEHPLNPDGYYGMSKLWAEHVVARYADRISSYVLRIAHTYGPGQRAGQVFTRFIAGALSGQGLTIYGDGGLMRDYLYVDDAVLALAACLGPGKPGVYNVGSGRGSTIAELAELVNQVFAAGRSPLHYQRERPGGADRSVLAVKRAEEALGLRRAMSLEEGLTRYRDALEEGRDFSA